MARPNSLHRLFSKDQDGTIAIYFTFLLFGFCIMLGLTIDGGRAVMTKTDMAGALNSATLAATRALMTGNPTDAEIKVLATKYFDSNLQARGGLNGKYDALVVNIDRTTKTVTISVKAKMPTTFAAVTNSDTMEIDVESQATYSVNDVELGLVLDVTGSMKDPANGKSGPSKISELKIAAANMFDILLPDNGAPGDTRIGIAPFAAAVNAGALADDVSHGASKDGCVVERKGSNKWTDADPTPNNDQLEPGKTSLVDIDPTEGSGGKPYSCPSQAVLPLTDDKNALKAKVNAFNADGPTGGHMGTAWGWYLVSPNWSSVWPADAQPKPYGTKNLVKAIIVMTDGIYNTAYNNGAMASQQAISLCNNAKAEGVVVYTVGFASPKGAEATLTACASVDPDSGKPNFYPAQNGEALTAAFASIAAKLGQLRVSR